MAPKNRQPKAVREVIDPDGDLILQLRRPKVKQEAQDDSQSTSNGNIMNGTNGSSTNGNTTTGHANSPSASSAISSTGKNTNGKDANSTASDETIMEMFELLVSSKMLCIVSPVFRTLLKGAFRESSEFSSTKSKKSNGVGDNDPYVLDLPEDDAMAMDLLTRVVHFRLGDVYAAEGDGVHSGLPNPDLLERLAFVCDKYQCTNALQGVSDGWLRENMDRLDLAKQDTTQSQADIEKYCRLLVFAYVADQPRVFSDLCWNLFLLHKGPMIANPLGNGSRTSSIETLSDHPLLPRDLAVVLNARRLSSCSRFHKALMSPVINHSARPKGSPECMNAVKVLGLYWRAVAAAGLLSDDLVYSELSVQDLCDGLDRLESTSARKYVCDAFCHCNTTPDFDPAMELTDSKPIIQGKKDGFGCLDCFRTERQSHKQQKCRVRHE